jgi:hypothetical protein
MLYGVRELPSSSVRDTTCHVWSPGLKRVQVDVGLPANAHIYTARSSLEQPNDLDGGWLARTRSILRKHGGARIVGRPWRIGFEAKWSSAILKKQSRRGTRIEGGVRDMENVAAYASPLTTPSTPGLPPPSARHCPLQEFVSEGHGVMEYLPTATCLYRWCKDQVLYMYRERYNTVFGTEYYN